MVLDRPNLRMSALLSGNIWLWSVLWYLSNNVLCLRALTEELSNHRGTGDAQPEHLSETNVLKWYLLPLGVGGGGGLTCTGTVQLSCSGVLGRGLAKATPAWAGDLELFFLRFFRALLRRFPFQHTRAILPSVEWATLLGIWSRLSDWLSDRHRHGVWVWGGVGNSATDSQRPEVTSQLSQDLWEWGTVAEPQGRSRSSLVERR